MPFGGFALGPARNLFDRRLEVYATISESAVSGRARLEDQRDARLGGDFFEAGAGLDVADEGFRFGRLGAELEVWITGCLSSVSLISAKVQQWRGLALGDEERSSGTGDGAHPHEAVQRRPPFDDSRELNEHPTSKAVSVLCAFPSSTLSFSASGGGEMTKNVGSSPITLLESRITECLCSPVSEIVEFSVRDDPLGRKVVRDPVQGGLRRLDPRPFREDVRREAEVVRARDAVLELLVQRVVVELGSGHGCWSTRVGRGCGAGKVEWPTR